jgi:hypothetical protein
MENEWTHEHEIVLADWADKSVCYKWLHLKSNEKYHSLHIWYTIPVIVMSTLTGTANFAQAKIPSSFRNYATMIIGGINILAGIITTIQQFLKINELNESHRVASISWDKFYRRVKVELSKNPAERQPVIEFFNRCTDEYDRLMEASPMIDEDILKLFKTTFEGSFTKESVKLEFKEMSKPEICDTLETVKKSIYKKSDEYKKGQIFKDILGDIMLVQDEKKDSKKKLISAFFEKFKEELNRPPSLQEMIDNLIIDKVDEHLGITEEMLVEFIRESEGV